MGDVRAFAAIDYDTIASELIRALRGRRSQAGLSRRLGYKSNMVHRWEAGQSWPTASSFLEVCRKLGVDVARSFVRFYGRSPAWLGSGCVTSPAAVTAFLRDQRGKIPINALAELTGHSRYSISRWLKGQAQPKLPEYLGLIEACTRRLYDYVATLIDPKKLASVAPAWVRLQRARELAYASPWSHAVLRALELDDARRDEERRGAGESARLALVLGIPKAEVEKALDVLRESGQIEKQRGRWVPAKIESVNTGQDPARARRLKAVWARVALERLERGAPGTYGYSVFAASRADVRRLRDLQLEYVRAMQAIVAGSSTNECVGLYCVQLLDLSVGEANALGPREPAE